jgi:hypothetical protein
MRNQSSYRINPNFLSPPPRYDLSIYSVSPLHKITTEINRINFPEFGRHGSSVELFVEIPIVSSTTPYSQTFARRRWICPEPAAPQIEQRRRQEPRQVSRRERAFHSSAREGTPNSYGEAQVTVEGSLSFRWADELIAPWGSTSFPAAASKGIPNFVGVLVFAVRRLTVELSYALMTLLCTSLASSPLPLAL